MEDTQAIPYAFLDHNGVLGRIHLPILTAEAIVPTLAKPPRVPMFQFLIPEHTLEDQKSTMAADSYTATLLPKMMALSLLDSLSLTSGDQPLEDHGEPTQETTASILGLARNL